MNFIKSNAGFSLVTTLVAITIGTIFMAALATFFTDSFKTQKRVKFKHEVESLSEEIRGILSSEEACTNTFSNLALNSSMNHNITNIKDTNSAPQPIRYNQTDIYGDNSILLSKMLLTNYRPSTDRSGDATFIINFQQQDRPERELQRTIEIRTEHDGSNRLKTCVATSKMTDGIWQRSLTNLNNIFYAAPTTGGNVGIGAEPLSTVPGDPGRGGLFVFNHPERGYGAIFSSWFTLGGNRTMDGSTGFNMYTTSGSDPTASIYRQEGAEGDIVLHNQKGSGGLRIATANQWDAFSVSDTGRVSVGVSHKSAIYSTDDLSGLTVKSHPQRGYGSYFSSWINLGAAREADGSAGINLNSSTTSSGNATAAIYRQTGLNGNIIINNRTGNGGVSIGSDSSMNTFYVSNSGNVGVGVTNPSSKLQVNGVVRANSSSSSTSSDRRIKENIKNIDNSLEILLALRPVSFDFIEAYKDEFSGVDKRQYGFIAQEVKRIMPDAVETTTETIHSTKISDFHILNMSFLNSYLVAAIQKIYSIVTGLVKRNDNLKTTQDILIQQIKTLEKKIYNLEKKNEELLEKIKHEK